MSHKGNSLEIERDSIDLTPLAMDKQKESSYDKPSENPVEFLPMQIVSISASAPVPNSRDKKSSFITFFLPTKDTSSSKKLIKEITLHAVAFILTFSAGYINAVSLYGLYHTTVAHVSGTVTKMGISSQQSDTDNVETLGLLVMCFFVGSVCCGLAIGSDDFSVGKKYGFVFQMHAVLLLVATIFGGESWSKYLVAMSCGLQNGMATTYSSAVIRTTHVTGIVTDLGLMVGRCLGKVVRREETPMSERDIWKFRVLFILLAGFFVGAFVGPYAYDAFEKSSLLVPCIISFVLGSGYSVGLYVQTLRDKIAKVATTVGDSIRGGKNNVQVLDSIPEVDALPA